MASADGAGRPNSRREQVRGQTGRTAPVVRLGVPGPELRSWRQRRAWEVSGPGAGNSGAGAWPG